MATKIFDVTTDEYIADFDRTLGSQIYNEGIKCRKTDADGFYSYSGKYRDEITVEFPNVTIKEISELWGIELDADYYETDDDEEEIEDVGSIVIRLSRDNGTTWEYYDSGVWKLIVNDADWNAIEDIESTIQEFILTSKQIKIKVKIIPSSDMKYCPILERILLHYTLNNYSFEEDIKRTIKHFLENNILIPNQVAQVIGEDTDTVKVNTDFVVEEITGVYNLTDDENRQNNLYESLESELVGYDEFDIPIFLFSVELTGIQDAGSIIEIQFKGSTAVFLASDEEEFEAKLPGFVVRFSRGTENLEYRNWDRCLERAETVFKQTAQPMFIEMEVSISCLAEYEEEAHAMNDSIARLLKGYYQGKNNRIYSEASGEQLKIFNFEPFSDATDKTTGLSEKLSSLILGGYYWIDSGSEEIPMAQEHIITAEIL